MALIPERWPIELTHASCISLDAAGALPQRLLFSAVMSRWLLPSGWTLAGELASRPRRVEPRSTWIRCGAAPGAGLDHPSLGEGGTSTLISSVLVTRLNL